MVHFTIVLGITGKGKSSFINAMKGYKVAELFLKMEIDVLLKFIIIILIGIVTPSLLLIHRD
jgi:hypothetical protein